MTAAPPEGSSPTVAPGEDGRDDGQTDILEWIVSSCTGFFTGDEVTITTFGEDPTGWCQSNLPPDCGPQDISRCMPEILDRCHQQGGDSESANHLAQYCGTFSQNSSSTYSSSGESSSSTETTYSSGSHCACDTVVNEICYTVNVYHQTNIYVQVDETTTTTGCFGDRTPCTTTQIDDDFGCEYPVDVPTWDPQAPTPDPWGHPTDDSPPTRGTGHDTPGFPDDDTPGFPVHGGPDDDTPGFPVHGGPDDDTPEFPGSGELPIEEEVEADPRFGTGFDVDVTAPPGAPPTTDFGSGAGKDDGPGDHEATPPPTPPADEPAPVQAAPDEPAPVEPPPTPVFEADAEPAVYEPAEPDAPPTEEP